MRRVFYLLIGILPLLLASCAHIEPAAFKNRNRLYLQAQSIPPLSIPIGLSSSSFDESYPVPERTYPPGSADVSLLPPDLR